MNMTIEQQIRGLQTIKENIPRQAEMIIERSKQVILDLIRIDQLFDQGIDGEGQRLRPYTLFTMAAKRAEGRDPNIVTLFDEGDFYAGFDLVFTDQFAIGVFSRDSKAPELVERYGSDIFIFTTDNNKRLNEEIIKPQLVEWVLSQMNNLI